MVRAWRESSNKLGQVPQVVIEFEVGKMVFDAVEIVSLILAFRAAVPLEEVPEFLGADASVQIHSSEGIVQPLMPNTDRGPVRHVVLGRKRLSRFSPKYRDQLASCVPCLPAGKRQD